MITLLRIGLQFAFGLVFGVLFGIFALVGWAVWELASAYEIYVSQRDSASKMPQFSFNAFGFKPAEYYGFMTSIFGWAVFLCWFIPTQLLGLN